MSQSRILIVHPDPSALALLSSMLRTLVPVIEEAPNDRVAVRLMEKGGIDMVLAGVDPTDSEALELLSCLRRKHRQVPVIVLVPTPNAERTKEALRLGALAVLRYPVPATELRAAVTQGSGPSSVPIRSPLRVSFRRRRLMAKRETRTRHTLKARPRTHTLRRPTVPHIHHPPRKVMRVSAIRG